MHDLLAQIYGYVLGVWRFRWFGLALAWVLALSGWVYVTTLPESYVARARLNVDSSTILRPLLRGLAIQPDVNQRVALMTRTLLSRENLEKLMRMSDMDLNAKTELEEEKLLNSIKKSISIRGTKGDSALYSISFKHQDRATAKRMVQSLITIFIESALGEKRKDSSGAQAFLDQQIAEYELRMSEAEARLAEFKQRNVGLLPGSAGGYYGRLDAAKKQLETTILELRELENRRDEIDKQLKNEDPALFSSAFSNSEHLSPIDRRIQGFQEQLDRLSISYTELHPEVVSIKSKIANLEAEKRAAIEEAKGSDSPTYTGSSPIYQSMRAMLAETEARIAELNVRVGEYKRRVQALEETVSSIPEIETELKALDRDYNVIASQHNALLQRREQALLSEQVEKNTDDVKFRVVDPPFVPLKPNEPNKLLLNSGVLLGSLGAGVALSFLLSLFRPVFMERRGLSQALGLPVLGVVSFIPSAEGSRKALKNGLLFISLIVSLVIVYAGVNIGQSIL